MIECRRRNATEDVRWIEQIATKRRSLRASKAIAVSTVGFSSGARLLAESEGIELRELHSISVSDIKEWADLREISAIVRQFSIVSIIVNPVDQSLARLVIDDLVGAEVADLIRKDALNAPLARSSMMTEPFSAGHMVHCLFEQDKLESTTEMVEGRSEIRQLTLSPANNEQWMLPTIRGDVMLQSIVLTVRFDYEIKRFDPSLLRASHYTSGDNSIAHHVQIDLDTCAGNHTINAIKGPDGLTRISISTASQSRVTPP